jgi:sulfatase modifying factor 1
MVTSPEVKQMRKLTVLGGLLCLVSLAAAMGWADTIASHLGHLGPAFAPGMTPSKLGWGPDDKPYPDKFVVNPKDGAEMAWIPPGEFLMGSTPEEQDYAYGLARMGFGDVAKREDFDDEGPQHKVRITKGFWLYRHTVTNAQYRLLRADHNSGEFVGASLNANKQPVVNVSWNGAREYCDWAGTRLPAEAEWEYACRAGTQTRFWWGESETEAGRCANVADRTWRDRFHAKVAGRHLPIFDTDDGHAVIAPVGIYKPNAFGLYDMLGNVWQWCADGYDAEYYRSSPAEDPPGPGSGEVRMMRGGSWFCSPRECRSASRGRATPGRLDFLLGFRCVRTP